MEVTNSELGPRYEGELNTAGYTEVGGNVKKLSDYRRPTRTGGRESAYGRTRIRQLLYIFNGVFGKF